MRIAMSEILDYCGYPIEISPDATDGLKKFKSNEYSLVIIDIELPEGSGLKLLRDIKKIAPAKPISTSGASHTKWRIGSLLGSYLSMWTVYLSSYSRMCKFP